MHCCTYSWRSWRLESTETSTLAVLQGMPMQITPLSAMLHSLGRCVLCDSFLTRYLSLQSPKAKTWEQVGFWWLISACCTKDFCLRQFTEHIKGIYIKEVEKRNWQAPDLQPQGGEKKGEDQREQPIESKSRNKGIRNQERKETKRKKASQKREYRV